MEKRYTDGLFDISGRVVVITGGSGILGSAMARAMAALGARAVIIGRSLEKSQALAGQIRDTGFEAMGLSADVMDKPSLEVACDQVMATYGRVDVLINGAGGNRPGATTGEQQGFFDLSAQAFREVFDLNLMGTVNATQVFGKVMAEQKSGSIINIGSMSGIRPLTNVAAYSAAKAALANFTQWTATHFSLNISTNIRVNAIAPGFFLTEQNRFLLTDEKTGEPKPRGAHILAQTPMGRYGQPEELIGAVVFLASDAARFVHGVVLPIDGGFAAYAI